MQTSNILKRKKKYFKSDVWSVQKYVFCQFILYICINLNLFLFMFPHTLMSKRKNMKSSRKSTMWLIIVSYILTKKY